MQALAEKADRAGIVGASGSGRALSPRLRAPADVVLANGAECEPLLRSDRALLESSAQGVLRGLTAAMSATGASEGVIAIRASRLEALETCRRLTQGYAHLRVQALPEQYPIGDAHILVPEVTGRSVPEGGRPEAAGVLVANVQTLWHLGQALDDKPVTWRYVTVGGEVKKPRVLRVPQGMSIADLVALCGGVSVSEPVFVLGGPMQGQVVRDDQRSLSKQHGGLFVFSAQHPLLQGRLMPIEARLKQVASACAGCRRCTDFCPRHQLGHRLTPHRLLRSMTQGVEDNQAVVSAHLCSGCGVCEVICPAALSPRAVYGAVQQALTGQGFENFFKTQSPQATGDLDGRRLPRSQVLGRFHLEKYQSALKVDDVDLSPNRVCIPVDETVQVVVAEGERVSHGQVLAKARSGRAWQHASIAGRIRKIGPRFIEIVMN